MKCLIIIRINRLKFKLKFNCKVIEDKLFTVILYVTTLYYLSYYTLLKYIHLPKYGRHTTKNDILSLGGYNEFRTLYKTNHRQKFRYKSTDDKSRR